jgi:Bucentaur or craniofacial development
VIILSTSLYNSIFAVPMDPHDNLPSDSNGSDDDDYCPEKDTDHKNQLSEEESGKEDDEEPISGEECTKGKQTKKKLKPGMRKRRKPALNRSRKSLKSDNKSCANVSDSTTENEEDDKEKADALWADFLNDTEPAGASAPQKPVVEPRKSVTEKENSSKIVVESVKEKEVKTFEYAGETVTTTSTTTRNTLEEELRIETPARLIPTLVVDKAATPPATASTALGKFVSTPRPKAGGLGSILSQIGKKNKISTIEKTKLDWDGFKKSEGIDEELQTHNKGKDG